MLEKDVLVKTFGFGQSLGNEIAACCEQEMGRHLCLFEPYPWSAHIPQSGQYISSPFFTQISVGSVQTLNFNTKARVSQFNPACLLGQPSKFTKSPQAKGQLATGSSIIYHLSCRENLYNYLEYNKCILFLFM